MTFFVVTMTHPQGDEWNKHVVEHVQYLLELEERGKLRASGQLKGTGLRSGFLIFSVANRAELDELVNNDPFSKHSLIVDLLVNEWVPFIGTYAAETNGIPEFARPGHPSDTLSSFA